METIFETAGFLEENDIKIDMYKKCKSMVNFICKYKPFSPECIKLLENCEKFKNIKTKNI